MRILRAQHLGMCFGVRDAIALAESAVNKPIESDAEKNRLTILGELVHNQTVNESLQEQGIQIRHQVDEVTTDTVMITAHGTSENALRRIEDRGLKVLEATCPLVTHAHHALSELVRNGYHPIIIGKKDHVEVRGMTDDLVDFDVIQSEEEIENLKTRPRFGIVSQTTQPIDRVRYLVDRIKTRYPDSEVRFSDTVCRPTKERQRAAIELARQCEIVIVIGGENSNNTRELAATCSRFCNRVYQIQNADGLREEWFIEGTTIGITAGTSTPDLVIDAVEERIREISRNMNKVSMETSLQALDNEGIQAIMESRSSGHQPAPT